MRLKETTLEVVTHAPKICVSGALGGRAECFSETDRALKASVLPAGGGIDPSDAGLRARSEYHLLVAGDAGVRIGDKLKIRGGDFRATRVTAWRAHTEIWAERM